MDNLDSGALLPNNDPEPYSIEEMKPRKEGATEGRANPKSIRCLYAATSPEIALAEMRPWIGEYMTIAEISLLRDLKIIDCRQVENYVCWYPNEPMPHERKNTVWGAIEQAFCQPVERSDNQADYAPTQILAELFKDCGFDGIAYRSAFKGSDNSDYNIVIFDVDATCVGKRGVCILDEMSLKWGKPLKVVLK